MKQLKISAVDFDGNQKEAAGMVQDMLERWAFRQDWNLENWDMVTSVELEGGNILKSDRLTLCDVAGILGFTGLWSDFVKQSARSHMGLTDQKRFRRWFSDRYRLYKKPAGKPTVLTVG